MYIYVIGHVVQGQLRWYGKVNKVDEGSTYPALTWHRHFISIHEEHTRSSKPSISG